MDCRDRPEEPHGQPFGSQTGSTTSNFFHPETSDSPMIEAQTSKQSQSHKLKERLQEAGFTHGESARVNLSGVALRQSQDGPKVYFCDVGPVQVVERIETGDGNALPEEAELSDVVFPRRGLHRLENAIIRTNGRMRVEADEKTEVKQEGLFGRITRFFRRLVGPTSSGPYGSPW